jgi:heme-degrading monooxygenase HmoA
MYVIVWEFRPEVGREAAFAAAYGPAGVWTELFRRSPGFLGTELLRSGESPPHYLTIDRWESREAYDAFRRAHQADYDRLDKEGEALTAAEARVGEFVVVGG